MTVQEKARIRARAWYAANREYALAKQKRYRLENDEAVRARIQDWHNRFPERRRAIMRKARRKYLLTHSKWLHRAVEAYWCHIWVRGKVVAASAHWVKVQFPSGIIETFNQGDVRRVQVIQ